MKNTSIVAAFWVSVIGIFNDGVHDFLKTVLLKFPFSPHSSLYRSAVTGHTPCVHFCLVPGGGGWWPQLTWIQLSLLTIPTALSAFLHYSAFSGRTQHLPPNTQSQSTDASNTSVGLLSKIVLEHN